MVRKGRIIMAEEVSETVEMSQEDLDMEELLITEEEQEEFIRFIEDIVIDNEIMAPQIIEDNEVLTDLEIYAGHFLFRDDRYWEGRKDFARSFHIKLCHINVLEDFATRPEFVTSLKHAIGRTFIESKTLTKDNITISAEGVVLAGDVFVGFLNKNPKNGQEDFFAVNEAYSFPYSNKTDFAETLVSKCTEYEEKDLIPYVENAVKAMTAEDVKNLNRDRKIETVSRLYRLKKFNEDIAAQE